MSDLLVVSGHSVLSAPLHVEGRQVQAEVLAGLLEEVVGHLLGDGVVQGLGHLVDQAHDVVVGPSALVEVIGLLQHLAEPLGPDVPVGLAPTLNGGGQEGVAETEGG